MKCPVFGTPQNADDFVEVLIQHLDSPDEADLILGIFHDYVNNTFSPDQLAASSREDKAVWLALETVRQKLLARRGE